MFVVAGIYVLLLVLAAWAFVCTNRAYKQQIKLIDDIYESNKASGYAKRYWHVIDSVSLEAHFWRLFTFRDPWAIYPPELAEVRRVG